MSPVSNGTSATSFESVLVALATPIDGFDTTPCHSRSRKIRCDGAKPVCHNCHTRPPTGSAMGECNYDPAPKRRGPDKVQGARTRTTHPRDEQGEPPRRRRRRTATAPEEPVALPSELFTPPSHSSGPSSHLLHMQTALPLPSFPSLQSHRDVVTDVQQSLLTLADVSQSLLDQPPHNVRYPPSASTVVFSHAFPGAPVQGHHPVRSSSTLFTAAYHPHPTIAPVV